MKVSRTTGNAIVARMSRSPTAISMEENVNLEVIKACIMTVASEVPTSAQRKRAVVPIFTLAEALHPLRFRPEVLPIFLPPRDVNVLPERLVSKSKETLATQESPASHSAHFMEELGRERDWAHRILLLRSLDSSLRIHAIQIRLAKKGDSKKEGEHDDGEEEEVELYRRVILPRPDAVIGPPFKV